MRVAAPLRPILEPSGVSDLLWNTQRYRDDSVPKRRTLNRLTFRKGG